MCGSMAQDERRSPRTTSVAPDRICIHVRRAQILLFRRHQQFAIPSYTRRIDGIQRSGNALFARIPIAVHKENGRSIAREGN